MKARSIAGAVVALVLAFGGTVAFSAPALADEAIAPDTTSVVDPTPTADPAPEAAPAAEPSTPAEEAKAEPVKDEPADPPAEPKRTTAPKVTVAPQSAWIIALWEKPANGDKFPQKLIAHTDSGTTADLHSLDDKATQCGTEYQVDKYADDEKTAELLKVGVLHGGEESWLGGSFKGEFARVFKTDPCPPPTVNKCDTISSGGKSTNLDANGWSFAETRTSGHNVYVAGGLHVYTEGTTSLDKAAGYRALNVPLKDIGEPNMVLSDTSGGLPGLQLNLDGYNLVHEGNIYGADKYWSNHDFGVGAGGGYTNLGTLDDYLAHDPNGVILAVGYSLGSGVKGDVILKSITAGCKIFTFGFENAPLPEPYSSYTAWVDGTYQCGDTEVTQTRTRIDYTYTNGDDGNVIEHASDPVIETQTRALTPEEIQALNCPTTPPTNPPTNPPHHDNPTPPTTNTLAHTGADAAPSLWVAGWLIALGAALYITGLLRKRSRI